MELKKYLFQWKRFFVNQCKDTKILDCRNYFSSTSRTFGAVVCQRILRFYFPQLPDLAICDMSKNIQLVTGGINHIFACATSCDNFYERVIRGTMIKSEKFENILLRTFPDSMIHRPVSFEVIIF